ncbi:MULTISPECIES: YqaJ viral recombinase family protein [unclassified Paraburkholderia]|uniref:YqaJ viral recombinase family nuclease n=1 Tax=unclassified Paraburkholderia TaxID=2615204 RepID=UPI00161E1707|nr:MULTISPECIES: YqaJ viral recombinase family protein [unclassified Paraburkholderia]MBB5443646.1 putative phage-type endonuclease [Paraburkholderia sp. WSM4177]MBB5484133.1 putative phage-type endonuclease [Paraburkholderia sp. WSM4180]
MNAREQRLADRQAGIGGSDVAAALGLSRYKTAYQLWAEKTDRLAPENLDDIERIRFGNLMEEIIAREYARRNDVKVQRRNSIITHPKYPFMRANVDRLIVGARRGLECKNVDGMAFRFGEWGEPGTDQVPDEYLLQCHHYMTVLDYSEWHLAACVGGNSLRTYIIERDAETEEMLIEQEHAFWQFVQRDEAPSLDYGHATTEAVLKRMHAGIDGDEIALPPTIADWHAVKLDADDHIKRYEAVSDAAKNHILEALGNAAAGLLPDGGKYTRKLIKKKEFTVEASSYIRLGYTKPKGAKDADETKEAA